MSLLSVWKCTGKRDGYRNVGDGSKRMECQEESLILQEILSKGIRKGDTENQLLVVLSWNPEADGEQGEEE